IVIQHREQDRCADGKNNAFQYGIANNFADTAAKYQKMPERTVTAARRSETRDCLMEPPGYRLPGVKQSTLHLGFISWQLTHDARQCRKTRIAPDDRRSAAVAWAAQAHVWDGRRFFVGGIARMAALHRLRCLYWRGACARSADP